MGEDFVSGQTVLRADEGGNVTMVRKPHPVVMKRMDKEFEVATERGPLRGVAGDWLAYDPITGNLWPVSASYVETHYERFDVPVEGGS